MALSHVHRGRLGEALASAFLELRGYTIVERNWRFGHLEIDLLARRGNLLAVVEVKYRLGRAHGPASAAVGWTKRRDLETAAVAYVKERGPATAVIRFDVIAIEGDETDEGTVRIRHLPGAFRASSRWRL